MCASNNDFYCAETATSSPMGPSKANQGIVLECASRFLLILSSNTCVQLLREEKRSTDAIKSNAAPPAYPTNCIYAVKTNADSISLNFFWHVLCCFISVGMCLRMSCMHKEETEWKTMKQTEQNNRPWLNDGLVHDLFCKCLIFSINVVLSIIPFGHFQRHDLHRENILHFPYLLFQVTRTLEQSILRQKSKVTTGLAGATTLQTMAE